jgi:hypothetical protein
MESNHRLLAAQTWPLKLPDLSPNPTPPGDALRPFRVSALRFIRQNGGAAPQHYPARWVCASLKYMLHHKGNHTAASQGS